jgi:hypothetical protein
LLDFLDDDRRFASPSLSLSLSLLPEDGERDRLCFLLFLELPPLRLRNA